MPDVTYADICAAVKKLQENNVPAFRCRECGGGFYQWLGWGMVGAGWRPGLEHEDPQLCEDCDFGEQFRGTRVRSQ